MAKDIELIVDDIKELVEDKRVALKFLKKLILTDENVFARCDDSSGSVQCSYNYAQDLYKEYAPEYLDEKTLLKEIKELLIHEGYGMRDILDESTPQDVLTTLYDMILEKYIAHKEEFGSYTYENILQSIARLLKNPELYVEALKKKEMRLQDYKLLDIALEYKAVEDEIKTSEYLSMIQKIPVNSVSEYFKALLWCDEKRDDQLALSNHLRDYYEKTYSTTILKRYLDRFNGELYKQEKMRILNNAKSLSFDEAIDQFIALDAKEMCAEFIQNKLPSISYINYYTIKDVEQFLCDEYAEIIIQLYKVQIDGLLKVANTKYYPTVVKTLKKIKKLGDASSQEYMQKIVEKHDKKKTLMRLLREAFPEI
ncbi:hypothetical protein [Sulfurimonas sp. NWX79]|uniref:hypothetical protein n=1 Tax=Sulfurimonas sp. NWX79 TaxID=2925412 RepID=UPI003204BABA